MDIFAKGTKEKVRFNTAVGNLNIEDMWDLPLSASNDCTSLDTVAKETNQELKDSKQESFVSKQTTLNVVTQLKMDILMAIIQVKLNEQETRSQAAENKLKRERILGIIANKEDTSLQNKSLTNLRKLVEELK